MSPDDSFGGAFDDWRNWKIQRLIGGQEEDQIFVSPKKGRKKTFNAGFFADDGGECGKKILFLLSHETHQKLTWALC